MLFGFFLYIQNSVLFSEIILPIEWKYINGLVNSFDLVYQNHKKNECIAIIWLFLCFKWVGDGKLNKRIQLEKIRYASQLSISKKNQSHIYKYVFCWLQPFYQKSLVEFDLCFIMPWKVDLYNLCIYIVCVCVCVSSLCFYVYYFFVKSLLSSSSSSLFSLILMLFYYNN